MTRVEIVTVALRLLAVWFLVQTVGLVTAALSSLLPDMRGGLQLAMPVIVGVALLLVLSALTWMYSEVLAVRVLPEPDPGAPVLPLGRQDLEAVAIRVLGMIFSVWAIGGIAYSFTFAVIRQRISNAAGIADEMAAAQGGAVLVQNLVQLIVGLCLVLGKEGLTRIWDRVRGVDHEDIAEPDEPTSSGS